MLTCHTILLLLLYYYAYLMLLYELQIKPTYPTYTNDNVISTMPFYHRVVFALGFCQHA